MLGSLRRTGVLALPAVAALSFASAPAAQAATCGPNQATIAAADVVFIGTLTVVNPAGERGTFAVEEVWKGGDLPTVVEVTGSPGQQWSDPSAAGARYLVLAMVVGSTIRVGSECNVAYLWDATMAAQRPATAHPPRSPSTGGGVPLPLFLIAGMVALIGVISFLAFRPTRGRASPSA